MIHNTMKTKKFKYALFILTALLSNNSLLAQAITLEDAINSALANNEKIKQYITRYEQKEYQNLAAWSNFLPKISLDARFTHLNDPLNIDLSGFKQVMIGMQSSTGVEISNIYNILQTGMPLNDAQKVALRNQLAAQYDQLIPSFDLNLKEQDYWSASFTGVMPLFYGGKLIAAKKYASLEEESASLELEQVKHEVANDVANTYLGVALLRNVVNLRKQVLNTIQKHRDEANRLFDEGIIANYDLLRAEVALSEAERKLFDDKNNLTLALAALERATGIENISVSQIADTLKSPATEQEENYYYNLANAQQPIFKLLDAKAKSVDQKYNVELSNFLPKIGLFGKYELYPEYLSALEPRWAVGVSASFNLFNGLNDYLSLQTASKLEEEVGHIITKTKKDINLYIKKIYTGLTNASYKYSALENDIKLAEENLHHALKRFEAGMGTMLELNDARVSLEAAQVEQATSKYDYYANLSRLYFICGTPEKFIEIWNLNGVKENE